jgi:hypothetical protein
MSIVRTTRNRVDVFADSSVAGGANDMTLLPVIPDGDRWRVRFMGMADPGTGDGISSVVALQIEQPAGTWTTVRALSSAGQTVQLQIDKEIKGNGSRRLRLARQNKSAVSKQIVAWLEGYKVE